MNRRSVHSINVHVFSTVKIICDAAYMINNVEAKWPGSVHDSRIFRESTLSDRFDRVEFIYSKAISYDRYFVSSYCN